MVAFLLLATADCLLPTPTAHRQLLLGEFGLAGRIARAATRDRMSSPQGKRKR